LTFDRPLQRIVKRQNDPNLTFASAKSGHSRALAAPFRPTTNCNAILGKKPLRGNVSHTTSNARFAIGSLFRHARWVWQPRTQSLVNTLKMKGDEQQFKVCLELQAWLISPTPESTYSAWAQPWVVSQYARRACRSQSIYVAMPNSMRWAALMADGTI
jgi:hypothetical protein